MSAVDPISVTQSRVQTLEEMCLDLSKRAHLLGEERMRLEGGIQALAEVTVQVEQHQGRLVPQAGQDKTKRADAEKMSVGLGDALTYIRAAKSSQEHNAYILWGRHQESVGQHDQMVRMAKEEAGRLAGMLAELERGVDRDLVGRPTEAKDVLDDISRRRLEAEEAKQPVRPRPKRRARTAAAE